MGEYQGLREEVDFLSLLFYILERWRWIIVSMLLFALLAGWYKYQSVTDINPVVNQEKEIKLEAVAEEVTYKDLIEKKVSGIQQQEAYLNNSVVMQMDPHHVSLGTLNYYMECEENMGSILTAYAAYVSGGELAEQLCAAESDVSAEDLEQLVSFVKTTYNKDRKKTRDQEETSKKEYVVIDDTSDLGAGTVVFQIQVRMPEKNLCGTYLEHAQDLIMEYSSRLQTQVADHKLILLSSIQTEMTDVELQQYQSDRWTEYMNSVADLETLQNKTAIGIKETAGIAGAVNPMYSAIKYALLGLALGAFFAFIVMMLMYLLSGRLQNTEDFKRGFGMPLLGIVRMSGSKKKAFGFIDAWIFRMREKSYAKISVEEQVKMAAVNIQSAISGSLENGNVNRVMFAGTIPEKDVDMLYTKLIAEMEGIDCSPYMQIVFQSSALKELDDYDGILFLEKRGVSQSRLIIQEKMQAFERGVKILGVIVIS